jgi:hypothetical protein
MKLLRKHIEKYIKSHPLYLKQQKQLEEAQKDIDSLVEDYASPHSIGIRITHKMINDYDRTAWMGVDPYIEKELKSRGFKGLVFRSPTQDSYDGSKVDFMLDDELSHLPKSDDVEKRWRQVKTYLGLASDKDEVVDYKNTTGLED